MKYMKATLKFCGSIAAFAGAHAAFAVPPGLDWWRVISGFALLIIALGAADDAFDDLER